MADKVEEGVLTTPARRSRSGGEGRQQTGSRTTRESAGDGARRGSSTRAVGRNGGGTVAERPDGSRNLQKDLRDFASARPQGWSHDDWLNFLESLKDRGHDIRDRDAIGMMLEKERLDLALSRTRGMGPQRRRALVDRYGTIWNLRNADVDEIASTAKIPHNLAESVKAELAT